MNGRIKRFVRNLISIVVILWLAYYLWKHRDILYATLDASWYHILGLVLCILMAWVLNCYQVLLLLRKLGVKVGFWENMVVLIAMILGNYLPMRIGTLVRMRYFKKVHGLQYMKFGGIIGVRVLILVASTGLLGCIGTIGLKVSGFQPNVALLCIFISMVVVSLGACLLQAPTMEKSKSTVLKSWSDLLTALTIIRSQPTLLCKIIELVLMQFVLLAIRLYISFDAIHIELSPWAFLMLAPMSTLLAFVSLTPGSLGLREWAIGVMSLASGIDFQSGIFAGTIDRAILMACTFIFGSGSLAYVWIRIKNAVSSEKKLSRCNNAKFLSTSPTFRE